MIFIVNFGTIEPGMVIDRLEKVRNILFYLALITECAAVIIDKSRLTNPYTTQMFRITAVVFLLVVLMTEYTAWGWAVIALAVSLGIVSYLYTGRDEIVRVVLFVAACKALPLKRTMAVGFVTTLLGCLTIIILALTGTFGEVSVTQLYRLEDGVATRFTLGFGHPNALQCMVYMLLLMALYLFDQYMRWYLYLLAAALITGVSFLTDSRTGLVMGLFSILIAAVMHYPKGVDLSKDEVARFQQKTFGTGFFDAGLRSRKISYILCGLVVVACVGISVVFAYNSLYLWTRNGQGIQILRQLDGLLNGRISNLYWTDSSHAGTLETWRLFSDRASTQFFDLGWVRLFYWYGIIPAALAVLMLFFFLADCYRRRDGQALMLVMSLSIYTVIEAHLVSIYIGRNFLLLILGAYWGGMLFADRGETYFLPELIRR